MMDPQELFENGIKRFKNVIHTTKSLSCKEITTGKTADIDNIDEFTSIISLSEQMIKKSNSNIFKKMFEFNFICLENGTERPYVLQLNSNNTISGIWKLTKLGVEYCYVLGPNCITNVKKWFIDLTTKKTVIGRSGIPEIDDVRSVINSVECTHMGDKKFCIVENNSESLFPLFKIDRTEPISLSTTFGQNGQFCIFTINYRNKIKTFQLRDEGALIGLWGDNSHILSEASFKSVKKWIDDRTSKAKFFD